MELKEGPDLLVLLLLQAELKMARLLMSLKVISF